MRDDAAMERVLMRRADFESLVSYCAAHCHIRHLGPFRFVSLSTRWGFVRQLDLRVVSIARVPMPQWGTGRFCGLFTLFAGRTQVTFGRYKEPIR